MRLTVTFTFAVLTEMIGMPTWPTLGST